MLLAALYGRCPRGIRSIASALQGDTVGNRGGLVVLQDLPLPVREHPRAGRQRWNWLAASAWARNDVREFSDVDCGGGREHCHRLLRDVDGRRPIGKFGLDDRGQLIRRTGAGGNNASVSIHCEGNSVANPCRVVSGQMKLQPRSFSCGLGPSLHHCVVCGDDLLGYSFTGSLVESRA